MNKVAEFDYENFDANAELKKIKSEIKKPNLFLCGATGVGKSSLVRDIFGYTLSNGPEIGEGKPTTYGVHKYENDELDIILHDSEGYEIGNEKQKYYRNEILGYIDQCNKSYDTAKMDTRIHEVWYCVSAGNKRFTGTDVETLTDLFRKDLPVCVIITKIDKVDEDEINELKKSIKTHFPEVSVFTYASLPNPAQSETRNELTKAGYIQRQELLDWATDNLDASLKAGLLYSVVGSLKEKHKFLRMKVIPSYVGIAVVTVIGNAFIPVPFTDSVALMSLQSTMAIHIMHAYKIASLKEAVGSLISSSVISVLGKTIAGSIVKAIPIIGSAVSITVNSTVAASLTAAIGYAVDELCYKYLTTCVDSNGKPNIPFADFFTPEALKQAITEINSKYGDTIKKIAHDANKEGK